MASQSLARVGESHVPQDTRPAEVEDLRSTVTVRRTHPSDCGQRQVFARLDEVHRIVLAFGDEVTVEVKPGRHRLRVHNTLFWKTLVFAIEPGERLEFLAINRAAWWTYGMAGLLGAAPLFLTVKRISLQ
jgi:hypothetical protein